MKPRHLIARWAADEGAIAPFATIMLIVLLGMTALTTDFGVSFSEKRDLQAATDAAALAAVSGQADLADDKLTEIRATAGLFLGYNHYGADNIVAVDTGTYCADQSMASTARFRPAADGITLCPGDTRSEEDARPNAVRLQTTATTPLFLSKVLLPPGTEDYAIRASATAARIDEAGFQVGTGLVSVDTAKSELLNAVLGNLLDSRVALTFADYNGLLNTDVQALAFLNALNVAIRAGTYDELLSTRVSVLQILEAEIAALNAPGSVASIALNALKGSLNGTEYLQLGDLLDLGVWRKQPVGGSTAPTALQAGLNLFQIATFAIQVANGENAIAIPAFTIGIPGILSIDVTATVIEPPQSPPFAFGPVGVSVHTAQVRLALTLNVLQAVNWLIGAQVPLYIEVASGDAFLADISCSADAAQDTTVTIKGRSAVANVYLGKVAPGSVMTNFSRPVTVQKAQLITGVLANVLAVIYVSANISIGTPADDDNRDSYPSLIFTKSDIDDGVTKRFVSQGMVRNLLTELLGNLNIEARAVLGIIPVNLSGEQLAGIRNLLANVLGGLLDPIVDPLLQALGIELGYMDVTVTGVRCGVPVLVQ